MNIVEVTKVERAALPLPAFRAHLRLGTGFADDGLQDDMLEVCLRGALARIEGHCGKAILARDFVLRVTGWRDLSRQALPMAPVRALTRFVVSDRTGQETIIAPERYRLIRDDHVPLVISAGYALPRIPLAGGAEIGFTAGFGGWDDVPGDLARAVLMLGAQYYEDRDGASERGLPAGIDGLLTRYRLLRLGAGGRS